jgi:hypothetical protein
MNVRELISYLSTFPQHLPVAYRVHSEQCMIEGKDIVVERCCLPRPDGWVHDARPDKETQEYLVLPGN